MSIKPSKPEPFEGRRDALTVNTWLYQVDVYFNVMQVVHPQVVIDETTKISFASILLKGPAANWWYMLVQSGSAPGSWEAFKTCVQNEFIPQDSVRRSREKLRFLVQRTSVSSYLAQFRNLVIGIPGMNDDEKLDRFVSGLKHSVKIEVLKASPDNLNDASRIALNVDNALSGAGMFSTGRFSYGSNSTTVQTPQPMDIGNVEGNAHFRGSSFKPKKKYTSNVDVQRERDLKNNACFTCHKPGCRPWKHVQGEALMSNAETVEADSADESEN